MTSLQIVEHLAREFSASPQHVREALEMIDAGLSAPFIGRVRRTRTGGMSEGQVRRLQRLRGELEELDRRRGTILRMLAPEGAAPAEGERAARSASPELLERIQTCMDRFELEDLFLPHRRPEPEVQLALDRGLGRLADLLVAPMKRPPREDAAGEEPPEDLHEDVHEELHEVHEVHEAHEHKDELAVPPADAEQPSEPSGQAIAADAAAGAPAGADAPEQPDGSQGTFSFEQHGDAGGEDEEQHSSRDEAAAARAAAAAAEEALLHGQIELTPALARTCAEFVSPDRGVHSEQEALSGAMRILSDRLGRDPRVRGLVRRLLRKQGVISVRATIDERALGRHKPLLKVRQPLRQVQGHRLLAIRQAQKERAVTTVISLERGVVLPKVRAALGRHTNPDFQSVLDAVALRTLEHRLLPLLDADVRLELKERADEEALRFLSQYLRQVLLTPCLGEHPVAGIDVSAKGDWTVALVDARGELQGEPAKIERGEKDAAALGAELAALLREGEGDSARLRVAAVAMGHGKSSRAHVGAVRAALAAAGLDLVVHLVNDSGVSSYANSELGRQELGHVHVPQRMAVSLARRLQDPLDEVLKIDPRHLGLGPEQGLVSKANLKRAFDETIESCCALVGCDINHVRHARLQHIPGLDAAAAKRLLERRAERPFESREDLRSVLDEVQWMSAAAFLRVAGSSQPLDGTDLHPEQYELAQRVLDAGGMGVEDGLGRPGVTKGLRRVDFDIDEATWRDLMRELAFPGRDPRPRLFRPTLLDPAADRATLTRERVVEGVISSVMSFGAFVDIGLENDAMIHVSEISDRYVRDARELVSIGQTVRARLLDGQAQRPSLSLKNVPMPERPQRPRREPRPEGAGGDFGGEGRRGRRGPREERREEPRVPVRAAVSRRDGLAGSGGAKRGGRPGGGGGRKPGERRDERGRDEFVHPEDLRAVNAKVSNNPFKKFFGQ